MNQIDKAGRKLLKERFNSSFLKRYYGEGYGDLRKRKIASKKSSKQIIESDTDPSTESLYVQYPGEEAVNVSGYRKYGEVFPDIEKLNDFLKNRRGRNYRNIHTHPYKEGGQKNSAEEAFNSPIPGADDIIRFLKNRDTPFLAIAQRDEKTGKVLGYVGLLKKDRFSGTIKKNGLTENEEELVRSYQTNERRALSGGNKKFRRQGINSLKEILSYKTVPAKGYRWDADKIQFVKKEGLENKIVAGVIAIAFASSLFFSLPNFTGYSISNFSLKESNFMFIRLFFIGLIFTYLLIKNKITKK